MKWPPKREGACTAHAPNPLKPQLEAQINCTKAFAQACATNVDPVPLVCGGCAHVIPRFSIMPAGHVHFAAEKCAHCGCLLRWVPKPATLERQRLNAFRLAKLAMCDRLSTWERGFVASVAKQKKLSPKQLEIIERLVRQYLEGKTP